MTSPIYLYIAGAEKQPLMDGNKIVVPYDDEAELALTRVTLLRHGVPQRVLDAELPVE